MTYFPKDFLWGVACASYQCEGGWNADGKGSSIWDDFSHTPGKIENGETGDEACDHYHRWKEDVALMKEMGLKAYRFSVSWSRVLPTGREPVNSAGLKFYVDFVDELLANGIEPCCTLYHWDLPSALQAEGGWRNRSIADDFAAYAAVLAKVFDGKVKYYITINEPQCAGPMGHMVGKHAPGLQLSEEENAVIIHNLLRANGAAIQALRANSSSEIFVGTCTTGRLCMPHEDTEENYEAARKCTFSSVLAPKAWPYNHAWFLDPVFFGRYPKEVLPQNVMDVLEAMPKEDMEFIQQKIDFIALNVYNGTEVYADGTIVEKYVGFPKTANRWPVTPEVLHYGPKLISERYGNLPIFISENGQTCNDRIFMDGRVHDPERIDFMQRYLLELEKAIQDGVNVKGYYAWSFLDNFEWNSGYTERFGLIYVDYRNQRRILKDSAYWYQKVISSNGECLKEISEMCK